MKRTAVSVTALRLALGVFFVVLGVEGVHPAVQESVFTLNDRDLGLELLFGVVEIACGLLLLLGLFMRRGSGAVRFGSLVVFLAWVARIVLTRFLWGLSVSGGQLRFDPGFPSWLMILAAELVVAAGLLVVFRAYE